MKKYNKLVRDRIPEIIEEDGKEYEIETLSDEEYYNKLKSKLTEEVEEFINSDEPEELADIIEVIKATLDFKNIDWGEIERLRESKREERGGFEEQILLIKAEE